MTPWTIARQAPLSMGFPSQEYWSSGLPFLSPGKLPDPGNEPMSPGLAGGFFTTSQQWSPSNGLVHVTILPFSLFSSRWCFTRDTQVAKLWELCQRGGLSHPQAGARSLKARAERPLPWRWQRDEDRPHQLHKSVTMNMGKNAPTRRLLCPEMI